MATQANQPQRETNNDFGLPKAEFKPIEPGGSNRWLKITAIIVGIVFIIGAGIVYWLFQRSSPTTNNFMSNTLKNYQEVENFPDDELKETDKMSDDFIDNLKKKKSLTVPWKKCSLTVSPIKFIIDWQTEELACPRGMDTSKDVVKCGKQIIN